ncbi:hypothetical protein VPH35_050720 [Triticum aestivum]
MASAMPWKPLFWERLDNSSADAVVARDLVVAIAHDLAPLLRGDDVGRALSLIGEWEEKLSEAGRLLGFLLSWLGTLELLALRRLGSGDTAEMRARPRAGAARERAGAAYDEVATCRGHLGAAARLVASGHLPDLYAHAQVVAARAVAAASVQLQGMDALRSRGEQAPALLPLTRSAHSDTRPAAAALARSVPDALLHECAHLPELEAAHAELGHCADALQSSSASDTYAAVVRALDAAHKAISRVVSISAGSTSAFVVAAAELGLHHVGEHWLDGARVRKQLRLGFSRAALDLLWSASACVDYHFGVVAAWRASPSQEGDQMMRRAISEAGEARAAAKFMGDASVRLFIDTSAILSGA